MEWKNLIVNYGTEAPDQLLANPGNWRIHPTSQQTAMRGVLEEIGWVLPVIVNVRTGHLVDGHMRVRLALQAEIAEVPVIYIDASPAQEATILATLDPLAAMAGTDKDLLDGLLRDVAADDARVQQLITDIAEKEKLYTGSRVADRLDPTSPAIPETDFKYRSQYGVIVVCESEYEQQVAFERLQAEGYTCRVVVT